MAVRIDRKTGRLRVEFQQGGTRILRRLHQGATREQARAYETKLRTEIFERNRLGIQPEISLAAAIQLWLEHTLQDKKDQRNPQQNARYLAPFVKGKTLRQAPEAAAEAISAWSTKESLHGVRQTAGPKAPVTYPLSSSTINRRLSVIKAAAKYAWRQNWINENVSGRITMLREGQGREVYLTVQEVRRLAACAPSSQCQAAIIIAAYTGLRASELLALNAISTRSTSLTVLVSKTGRPRVVPVPGPARPFLRALPLGLDYSQLNWQWRKARIAAGLPHVHFHDLRHTCASWLINAGVDLFTVGRILGHSTPLTTARYSHLQQKTLRKAMEKLKR